MIGPKGGYSNAADWAALNHTGCCSVRCAILKNLSLIVALDKSALLPFLANVAEEPTKVMSGLEDEVRRLQRLQEEPPLHDLRQPAPNVEQQIECWSCSRKFDKSQIRWVLPFPDSFRRSDKPYVIKTPPAVSEEPKPGAEAWCPKCLEHLIAE